MRHHPARARLILRGVSGSVQVLPTAERALGVSISDAEKYPRGVLHVLRILNVLIE